MCRQTSSLAVLTAATASSRPSAPASRSILSAISAKRASRQAPIAEAEPLMVWAASLPILRGGGLAQARDVDRDLGRKQLEHLALEGGIAERKAREVDAVDGLGGEAALGVGGLRCRILRPLMMCGTHVPTQLLPSPQFPLKSRKSPAGSDADAGRLVQPPLEQY